MSEDKVKFKKEVLPPALLRSPGEFVSMLEVYRTLGEIDVLKRAAGGDNYERWVRGVSTNYGLWVAMHGDKVYIERGQLALLIEKLTAAYNGDVHHAIAKREAVVAALSEFLE